MAGQRNGKSKAADRAKAFLSGTPWQLAPILLYGLLWADPGSHFQGSGVLGIATLGWLPGKYSLFGRIGTDVVFEIFQLKNNLHRLTLKVFFFSLIFWTACLSASGDQSGQISSIAQDSGPLDNTSRLPDSITLGWFAPGNLFTQFRAHFSYRQVIQLHNLRKSWQTGIQELQSVSSALEKWRQISGSSHTKHGILAERLEISARNAHALAKGAKRIAHNHGLPLNHPVDFFLHDIPIQAKCHANTRSSLQAISNHWKTYQNHPGFRRGMYMLPKDQYRDIQRAMATGTHLLTPAQKNLRLRTQDLLQQTGVRHIDELIFPAVSSRKEMEPVQLQSTIARLKQENQETYQRTRHSYLKRYGALTFLSGFMTGVGLQLVGDVMTNQSITEKPLLPRLYSLSTAGLYGGISSATTFYLSSTTGLPATICAAVTNIVMRSLNAARSTPQGEPFTPQIITIVGEEAFTSVGASLFYGHLIGQLGGAMGGLLLWHGLQ